VNGCMSKIVNSLEVFTNPQSRGSQNDVDGAQQLVALFSSELSNSRFTAGKFFVVSAEN
jgi:hypothetical protein